MSLRRIGIVGKLFLIASTFCFAASDDVCGQNPTSMAGNTVHYEVTDDTHRIQLVASTSRVLKMEYDVPFVVVGNQQILKANPVSPNQILITAIKPGVTALSMTDPQGSTHTIEIHVIGDARELQSTLDIHFPKATVKATAVKSDVLLSGHVEKMDDIPAMIQISKAYFPNVINRLSVGGSQKIMLKVKVVEVSRTKLRKLGIDWSALTDNFNLIVNGAGLINGPGTGGIGTIRASVTDGTDNFNLLIDTLEQNNLAKLLAEPTLVTMSGRPAGFLNGGEVPVPINTGLGVQSVQFQSFGTKLDFVPIVLGEGRIRLEVRPEVRELAGDLRDPVSGAPGFRTRRVDTGVEMQVGHTLALAGLMQNRVDSVERGIPVLKDMPWVGAAFRRVEESFNEVELVVLVTPYFIHEVDECILPTAPGRSTVSPNDEEFYLRGYTEVPRCNTPYELGPFNGGFHGQTDLYNQQYLELGQRRQYQETESTTVETAPEQQQVEQPAEKGFGTTPVTNPETSAPVNYSDRRETIAPRSTQPRADAQNTGFGQPPRELYSTAQNAPTTYDRTVPATNAGPETVLNSNNNVTTENNVSAPTGTEVRSRYFPRPTLFGIDE